MTYKERQKLLKQKAKDFEGKIKGGRVRMSSHTSSLFFAYLLSDGHSEDVVYIREVTN